jgi:hypothetical protein
MWLAAITLLSVLRHMRSVRCLTNLSRASQDFDYCPCSRAPELQLVGRLPALNSVFNITKVLPNNIDCPVTMTVDQASSGDPGNTVHGVRIGAESLREVKLTINRKLRSVVVRLYRIG